MTQQNSFEVMVFEYADATQSGWFQPGFNRCHNVEVREAKDQFRKRSTDSNGLANWPTVSAGSYRVTITPPTGYQLDTAYVEGDTPGTSSVTVSGNDITVNIKAGQPTKLMVGLKPDPVTLKLSARRPSTNASGGVTWQPLLNVPFELFHNRNSIGSHVIKGAGVTQKLDCHGTITIRPQPTTVDGNVFEPTTQELQVSVKPGQQVQVVLDYVESPGAIEVKTFLVHNDGSREEQLLPGARYGLWRGGVLSGRPFRTASSNLTHFAFAPLSPGHYTVSVIEPPNFQGQPLAFADPTQEHATVMVIAGQTATAAFDFQMVQPRLQGRVTDAAIGDGLEEVVVHLRDATKLRILQSTTTNTMGDYVFQQVPPGEYIVSLAAEQMTLPDGSRWELSDTSRAQHHVSVGRHRHQRVTDFQLQRTIHRVHGLVSSHNGDPVAFAVVQIQDADGNRIDMVSADATGHYEWIAAHAGVYYLVLPQTPGGGPLRRVPAVINSTATVNLFTDDGGISNSHGQRRPQPPASDFTVFPILTEEVDSSAVAGGRGGAGRGASGPVVDRALRQVLSWRPRKEDPKGFLTALNQSMTLKEVDGRSVWQWTPRSYAVQVEAGAITGAQASIYTRAKNALDQALPQLKHLVSLGTDTDAEQQQALLAIIESEFTELVNEFGYEGGPRVQRVDMLFQLLLGDADSFDKLSGHLGDLQEELDLEPANVNTVDEEHNLTRFSVSVDYLIDLRRSWEAQRNFFNGSGEGVFLGTQLVLIGRALTVIAESVQEVYYTMDSVFMGAAERQATQLQLESGPMLVSELLGWAEHVATEEGPRLIRDGGRAGVIALHTAAQTLAMLVQEAQTTANRGNQAHGELPEGYATPRVQRALAELQHHLAELATLAGQLAPDGALMTANRDGNRRRGRNRITLR